MDNKVPIIVPIYNVELYLEKCVNSLINQTYNNIEIYLVDDGSTDESGSLCDKLSKRDKRIFKYYRIMSDEQTIVKIINERYSLAWFWAGEFKRILDAKTIKIIIVPSINAFDKYDEIISETKKQNKENLILISLRIYSYNFSKWFIKDWLSSSCRIWRVQEKNKEKTPIKGKYVNEAIRIGDLSDEIINDESYKKSIIKVIPWV